MILPRQDDEPATPLSTKLADVVIDELRQVEENEKAEAVSIVDCKTPTAKEHRIPDPMTCPPAPRKPRVCPAVLKGEFPKKIGVIKAFYAPLDLELEALWSSKER